MQNEIVDPMSIPSQETRACLSSDRSCFMSHRSTAPQVSFPKRSSAHSLTTTFSLMSFINNIEFHPHSQGNPSNQRSASPDQGSQTSVHGPGSPTRQSQMASPNPDVDRSRRDLDRLRSHAVVSARRDRLSTTAEERLIDFAQVRHKPPPTSYTLTFLDSSPSKKN